MLRNLKYDPMPILTAKINESDAKTALKVSITKCKADSSKAKTIEGFSMIFNDYCILVQKYLYVLNLPVEHFKNQILDDNEFKGMMNVNLPNWKSIFDEIESKQCLYCQTENHAFESFCKSCNTYMPK